MNRIKSIPAHVPFCHKNYDVAEQLATIVAGNEAKKPWNVEKKSWEAIEQAFQDFYSQVDVDSISCEWETVESFFEYLIEQSEKREQTEAEGIALASVDTEVENSDSESESNESILDLTEQLKDRETQELAEQTLRLLEDEPTDNVRKYKSVVDAAISAALTRRRGSSDEIPDYKTFSAESAKLKEFGRINEKVNYHPAMKTLALYRAMNEELTAIKPIVEKPRELFIMVDDSGSMDTSSKRAIVNLAILMAKKRTKSGITVKLYFFKSDLYDREYDLATNIPEVGFHGGGTDVEKALISLADKIQSPNASILVINDGEDTVSNLFKPVRRMVSLTLLNKNKGLENAALRSGGKYFTV